LRILIPRKDDESTGPAQTLEDLGKFFRAVPDPSQSSKISVDGPIHFNRAEPIFHHGRSDDWRADADKDKKQRRPKACVKIKARAHFDLIRC
jgi:hypothetical protein